MKAETRDNLIGSLCAAAVLIGGILLAILLFA
jgi:hypothetical protein